MEWFEEYTHESLQDWARSFVHICLVNLDRAFPGIRDFIDITECKIKIFPSLRSRDITVDKCICIL